jgi:hypothetical protein
MATFASTLSPMLAGTVIQVLCWEDCVVAGPGQAQKGKILDDILMRLDHMDIVLFEQKLSSPCPGKWLERDVPPMLRCEFVRC